MEKFKIKKTEYVVKSVRMPEHLFGTMDRLARQQGISLNKLIVQCCEYALEHLDDTPV